jgi:GT2 family glycosyltransferase
MRVSVILPTYSRVDVLERTLRAYLGQLRAGDELLVVDDGSTDATPELLARVAAESGGVMRWWRQENAGPAAARNRALREASGELILFAGDDVIPEPDLVAAHLAAHERFGRSTVVLGRIQWHPELQLTPFMRWLEEGGVQFAYGALTDGAVLPPEMHYTSNLSVPRVLLPPDPVFDERFRAACWEDVDLGMRLAAAGVQLRYAAAAKAWHWHPMDLARARMRAERVGYYRAVLHAKHGVPAERRVRWWEWIKRMKAPWLRVMPVGAVRRLGFRWSLAWADMVGYARFRSRSE